MPGTHLIGRWRKLPAEGGNFRVDCGGEGAQGKEWENTGSVAQRSALGQMVTPLECSGTRL